MNSSFQLKNYMIEPDVALTDFGLALLTLFFFLKTIATPYPSSYYKLTCLFFYGSTFLASFLGGMVHGWFIDEKTLAFKILWPLTLVCIGIIGITILQLGLFTAKFSSLVTRTVQLIVVVLFIVYIITLLKGYHKFLLAILFYLPSLLFLFIVLLLLCLQSNSYKPWMLLVSVILSFLAAAIQQLKISIHPTYFNHNALYHVIQGIGLVLFYLGCKELGRYIQ